MPKKPGKPIIYDAYGRPANAKPEPASLVKPGIILPPKKKIIVPENRIVRLGEQRFFIKTVDELEGSSQTKGQVKPVAVSSEAVLKAILAAGTTKIAAAKSTQLEKAHSVFMQMRKLRNWQVEKSMRLLEDVPIFKKATKIEKRRGTLVLVAKRFEREMSRVDVKMLRGLLADIIIDHWLSSRELIRVMHEHNEELVKGLKKR